MNYIFVFIGAVAFISCKSRSCKPELSFDRTQVFLKNIKYKEKTDVYFTIYNKGNCTLAIEDVLPDCHCTVSKTSKKEIRPNDSSILRATFDPQFNTGFFQKIITVKAIGKKYFLIIRGTIEDSK